MQMDQDQIKMRYEFANQFCKNKKIIEIGPGTGYGSEKLIKSLEKETGIKVQIITGKKESEIVAKNDITSHIGKTKNYQIKQ